MTIKTIEELKKLMKDLGASEETTSDGFTFIELDSRNLKKEQAIVFLILSKKSKLNN